MKSVDDSLDGLEKRTKNMKSLSLFTFQTLDSTSIMNTKRVFDTMDVWVELKSADDVKLVDNVYQRHSATVKKLDWCNWSPFALSGDGFASMLNRFLNLEKLKISSWQVKLVEMEGKAMKLNLPKLKRLELEDCDPFIVDFFAQALPSNVLRELRLCGINVARDSLKTFIAGQSSITDLDAKGDFSDPETFQQVKLTRLRCILIENESPSTQRIFLKTLIKSQPALVTLDTFSEQDYSFTYVNDEVFEEITKLQKLEKLRMNIDGISPEGIKGFAKLGNLKTFETKTNRDSSLEVFRELSLLQKLPLENLILHLWSFEIPAQTYQQFGQNYQLKSLTITLGTWHKINFFTETFPTLESLSVRFGEANNTVEFSKVYIDDNQLHLNIKSLNFKFWGRELMNDAMFFRMLKSFPNLESLQVHSMFPCSASFIRSLAGNLSNLKVLKLSAIDVKNNEKFAPETIESFKELRKKLYFCSLSLSNIQDVFFGDVLDAANNTEHGEDRSFTFKPLVDALKYDFNVKESSMANIRIYNTLVLTAGVEAKN